MKNRSNDQPVPFGYKMGWLAIRSTDVAAVVNSLPLAKSQPATWAKGVKTVYRRGSFVFVTPEMNGWILVAGSWFMTEDPGSLITRLSAQFGETQAFATFRILEYHHWMLARNGVLERAFAFSGDSGTLFFNIGQLTAAERSLPWDLLSTLEWSPDEETVMTVAGQWSINPTTLSAETPFTGMGVLAKNPNHASALAYMKYLARHYTGRQAEH